VRKSRYQIKLYAATAVVAALNPTMICTPTLMPSFLACQ